MTHSQGARGTQPCGSPEPSHTGARQIYGAGRSQLGEEAVGGSDADVPLPPFFV